MRSQFPAGQVARYLCVGVFNTVFGYTTFAIINFLLSRQGVPVSYIFASIISNFINNTVAYLGYKTFVFKTEGHYIREWLKAMAVYFSGAIPGLLLLSVLVRVLNWILPSHIAAVEHVITRQELAPYIANAICIGIGVIISFLGHKNVTFRQRSDKDSPLPPDGPAA